MNIQRFIQMLICSPFCIFSQIYIDSIISTRWEQTPVVDIPTRISSEQTAFAFNYANIFVFIIKTINSSEKMLQKKGRGAHIVIF